MKAFEMMGNINEDGQLLLDEPLKINKPSRVKIILLVSDEDDFNSDDDPIDEVKDSLKKALIEVRQGKTRPISELWERINE